MNKTAKVNKAEVSTGTSNERNVIQNQSNLGDSSGNSSVGGSGLFGYFGNKIKDTGYFGFGTTNK